MQKTDQQMRRWSAELQRDMKIGALESSRLATTIKTEVINLPDDAKQKIMQTTETEITLSDRIHELGAFQQWMSTTNSLPVLPIVVRAQVVAQNYFCFIYLGESCFKALRQYLPTNSTTRKCCSFLINNPVRAFRNALAHANWKYKDDYSAIEFWARKGDNKDEALSYFEVSQDQLDLWQSLARCTAYAAFLSLRYRKDDPFWKNAQARSKLDS